MKKCNFRFKNIKKPESPKNDLKSPLRALNKELQAISVLFTNFTFDEFQKHNVSKRKSKDYEISNFNRKKIAFRFKNMKKMKLQI